MDIQRVRGELYSRQDDPAEADELFAAAVERLGGLDGEFIAVEATIPVYVYLLLSEHANAQPLDSRLSPIQDH